MDESEAIIRVAHVSKVFGRRVELALALRRAGKSKEELEQETGATIGVFDASFEVKRGQIFVVIGLSGSGKSTLLRCINRLIEPTAGEIYVDGAPLSRMPIKHLREVRRTKIGMVFQHFGLLPNRTVLDNVTFGLEIQGLSAKARLAESVMVAPKDVAYQSEGPQVVLRRMKNAGLSTIFVLDEERRLVGLADVDAIAALAEKGEPELRAVVERTAPRVQRQTCLRDILPFFVDHQIPVAVTDEAGRLVGVITRGTLIAGLAASAQAGQETGPLDVALSVE